MKKFLIFLLCGICAFSVCGCTKPENTETTAGEGEPTSFTATDYTFVINGRSDYKIVIPQTPSKSEQAAAEELQLFVEESTGCELPIIVDAQIGDANSGAYLSVGKTRLFDTTGIKLSHELVGDCVPSIKTVGNDVFMCGSDETGTLYSVYKFLYYQFGFVAYSVDCVKIDYYPKEVKLLNFDYNYVPTVNAMTTHTKEFDGISYQERLNAMRMYMLPWENGSYTMEGQEYTMWCHTLMYLVSKNLYGTTHPEWYNNGQYCLSNPELIEECATNFINLYAIPYNNPYIMLGGDDNNGYCKCANCEEQYRLYGGTGGVFVRFANAIAERTEKYFEEHGIEKELCIVIMAYAGYQSAPVVENADGTMSPAHESVVCDTEGQVTVGVNFSPLHMCHSHSLDDPDCETNLSYNRDYKGWASLTDYLSIYVYNLNYTQPKIFHNSYWALADTVKALANYGTQWIYQAGARRQPFNALRFYVHRQMMWDYTQNVEELINEFINEYYGVGGNYVREYFDAVCHQTEVVYKLSGTSCAKAFTVTGNTLNWPHEVWKNFANILENGIYAIENSDMTQEDKEIYKERIVREWVLVKVEEWKFYANSVDDETLAELEAIVAYAKDVYGLTRI